MHTSRTAAIGVLPTYGAIGIAAPILLLLLRLLQGLGAGAEYAGAILFAAEYGSTRQRGFFASWPPSATDLAIAISAGVFRSSGGDDSNDVILSGSLGRQRSSLGYER